MRIRKMETALQPTRNEKQQRYNQCASMSQCLRTLNEERKILGPKHVEDRYRLRNRKRFTITEKRNITWPPKQNGFHFQELVRKRENTIRYGALRY